MNSKTMPKIVLVFIAGVFAMCGLAQSAPSIYEASGGNYNPNASTEWRPENSNDDSEDAPVEPRLQLIVQPDTKEITYIRDSTNATVVTKAYRLQNADPYEILPYIRNFIGGARYYTGVASAIVFNDGAKFVLVSAEDYKFNAPAPGTLSVDEVIKKLDLPNMVESSGKPSGTYWPKYRSANDLTQLLALMGLTMSGDTTELIGGNGGLDYDADLGLMYWMGGNPVTIQRFHDMVNIYDRPLPQARVKYTVYELDFENSGAVGFDYQGWKNGPGQDLFSAMYSASNGWNQMSSAPYGMNGVATRAASGLSQTRYVRFSPKWNTKYLDFLTVRGNAKIMTSGSIDVMNRQQATLTVTDRIGIIQGGDAFAEYDIYEVADLGVISITPNASTTTTYTGTTSGGYRFTGYTHPMNTNSSVVSLSSGTYGVKVYRLESQSGTNAARPYIIETYGNTSNGSGGGAILVDGSAGSGRTRVLCYNLTIDQFTATVQNYGTATLTTSYAWVDVTDSSFSSLGSSVTLQRDVERDTIATTNNSFSLTLYPIICRDRSSLQVDATSISMIGFESDGTPRTSTSTVSTRVSVKNDGSKFVIGGLDRKRRIRNNDGIPFLCKIPFIGNLFSREIEEIQNKKVVLALEIVPLTPSYFESVAGICGPKKVPFNIPDVNVQDLITKQIVPAGTQAEIAKVDKSTAKIQPKGMDSMNQWGFGQWFVDTEKE